MPLLEWELGLSWVSGRNVFETAMTSQSAEAVTDSKKMAPNEASCSSEEDFHRLATTGPPRRKY